MVTGYKGWQQLQTASRRRPGGLRLGDNVLGMGGRVFVGRVFVGRFVVVVRRVITGWVTKSSEAVWLVRLYMFVPAYVV